MNANSIIQITLFAILTSFALIALADDPVATPYFGIHVVDESTGRGIPLIELRTVNEIASITDNAGWIAFNEPGLMGREVFFHVSGPGYQKDKDGFGYSGVRLATKAGQTATVKLKRTIIAQRIGRTTGQGLYRNAELLGLPHSLPNLSPSGVMGQDSVQSAVYRGRLFWLWGDTNIPNYPLGNFRTTSATSALEVDPEKGIAFDYLMDKKEPKNVRHMIPIQGDGAVWLFGMLVVNDERGEERLLAHFGRYRGLKPPEEHGIAQFNDGRGVFEKLVELKLPEGWRHPRGNAVRATDSEGDYFYFSSPFCHTRVRAKYADVISPESYEAFRYDEGGHQWRWQKANGPTTQRDEERLIRNGKMPVDQAHFALQNAAGKTVNLHAASIQWNAFRKRWILLGEQSGGDDDPSALGEMWYAESPSPAGPWRKAVKVVSHPHYSFYNPVHHAFLDRDGGRIIYFEGTYCADFSGNPLKTPRYDYNELMYRLDLDDPRLEAAR